MSGGHFEYNQYEITNITESIKQLIEDESDKEKLNEYGDKVAYGFSEETIESFGQAVLLLEVARIYIQRIDWLMSGDDSEDSFHIRLKNELAQVANDSPL